MSKPEAPRRTLFHGPFGAGQSRHARDAVCAAADAGARDILHVVANRAAELAVRSELVNRRKAVFGLRVVTLKRLPREIERRARIKGAAIAGGAVDEILLERAIRTAAANATSSVVATGLASSAARTIAEVERGGGTFSSFEAALTAIHERGDGATVLLETWRELERLRGPDSRSQAVAQRAAIQLLETRESSVMNDCSLIVLEDLPLFGPLDRDMMKALVATASCPIVATSEYAAHLDTSPALRAYYLLRSTAQWDEKPLSCSNDPLDGAGDRIFAATMEDSTSRNPSLEIVRLEAAGETAEVRLAARVVLRHLRESNARDPMNASDIMIVARGGRYRELIQEIFTETGIGVNAGARLSASETSLGSVLLDLLRMAADGSGGTREQALKILRSPHLDLGTRAADRLTRRVRTLGYLGVDGWDRRVFHALGKRTRRRVVRFRRSLGAAREAFAAASSNKEMAFAVRKLAKELRLVGNAYFARKRASAGGSGSELETRLMNAGIRDDNQTWEMVEQVLDDTMPDMLNADASADASGGSDAHLSFAERWISLFERALDDETLQRTVSGDGLVRVAGASAGDGQPARVTIILGLRQQAFPRQARQNPFLRDTLRTRLADFGIELAGSEDAAESEREAFIRVITTASETLYLSYAATDAKGKAAVASFFIEDLQRAIGKDHHWEVERLGIADVAPSPEDAVSRSEMLAAVAHGIWQRLPAIPTSIADRSASFAAWNDLLANSASVVPVSSGRMAELRPSFSADALQFAPHHTLELSASQLKTIQHCTYEHFVKKVFHPGDLAVPEYDAPSKGTLVHEAMMQWVRLDGWKRGDAALGELDGWFANRATTLPPSAREGRLARFMMDEDRGQLNVFVRNELDAVSAAGAAKPAYNELAFGQRIAAHGERDPASVASTFDLAVQTSMGPRVVKFTGSIDRVDTYQRDQTTYGIALDYKTGATSKYYSDAMHDGTDLQLRLYLLALERLWGVTPVGALYVGFGDGVRRGAISEVAEDRIGEFDPKTVTVMKHDVWDKFVHSGTEQLIQRLIERLVTFDIVAQPDSSGCGFCELGPICRYTPNGMAFIDG